MPKIDPKERDRLVKLATLGRRAREILDDEVYQAALGAPEETIYRQWQRSKRDESELREQLWLEYDALAKVRKRLTNLEAEGIRAVSLLEKEEA